MRIAIIGGGITGLTSAIALKKQGISSNIYEQAPVVKAVGAGIWLQPNAMKVLDFLGLGDEIRSAGMSLKKVDIADKNLKAFSGGSSADNWQNDFTIISIHRGELQKILMNALAPETLKLNHAYVSHKVNINGLEINFENQNTEADIILAADGINSKVRQFIFPESFIRNADQVCWRGIADINLPNNLINVGRETWGHKVRFGFSQVSENKVYWFAVLSKDIAFDASRGELKSYLVNSFKLFHPLIEEIIKNTPFENIHRSELADLKRLKSWNKGNVCLIGDAAHATTPNMGQGACQGIEDAYYLSTLLSESSDFSKVFVYFENSRREKVDYVVNNSWRFGKMAHHPLGQFSMKWMMKATPQQVIKKQLATLYNVKGL